nr:peptidase C19, ubiquitin carboxyl-terminal hydrolase 2 [Tanacetum cinerariifolium]
MVSEAKDHSTRCDVVASLSLINRVIKETTPLSLKHFGFNHMVEAKKSANVTPTCQIRFHSTFYFDHVLSPQTPPTSPGLDLSEDENTIFAAKLDQLKITEETANKKRRGDTVAEKSLTFVDTVGRGDGRVLVKKNLKFADMEGKRWGLRSAPISKTSEEKNSAIQQDNKLQQ